MRKKVVVVDYGSGNLHSVAHALRTAAPEVDTIVSNSASAIAEADRIVLPGQGAMPDCMHHLTQSGLREAVIAAAQSKPLLGICIGQQMLFEHSDEGNVGGLGVLEGRVVKFPFADEASSSLTESTMSVMHQADGSRCKAPHMGWNGVEQVAAHPLWQGIPQHSWFYFVHSFYVQPQIITVSTGLTTYGVTFTSAVTHGNIFATQFHPEKSAQAGLRLFRNFVEWNP